MGWAASGSASEAVRGTLATRTHTIALSAPWLVIQGEPGERKPRVFSEAWTASSAGAPGVRTMRSLTMQGGTVTTESTAALLEPVTKRKSDPSDARKNAPVDRPLA